MRHLIIIASNIFVNIVVPVVGISKNDPFDFCLQQRLITVRNRLGSTSRVY